jgi:hypothetical protein
MSSCDAGFGLTRKSVTVWKVPLYKMLVTDTVWY